MSSTALIVMAILLAIVVIMIVMKLIKYAVITLVIGIIAFILAYKYIPAFRDKVSKETPAIQKTIEKKMIENADKLKDKGKELIEQHSDKIKENLPK